MANGKRNEAQSQAATEPAAAERLKVGHAGLGNACWSRTLAEATRWPRSATPRRSVLHRVRPLRRAETRLPWRDHEFLPD
ncbi:MAG TPA: hypothetical protein VMT66_16760 [Steroidobacteraceae bacterium]|nr:hypothetical protein [Steroidobacteraceae bacterium]